MFKVPQNHLMPCHLQDSLDGMGQKRGQACWRFVQLVSAAAVAVLLILGIVGCAATADFNALPLEHQMQLRATSCSVFFCVAAQD